MGTSGFRRKLQNHSCPHPILLLPCASVNQSHLPGKLVAGECAQPELCPLSKVKAGTMVCVRELAAAPNVQDRLREIGLGEAQRIRLLTSEANVICQVCNARVAISQQLAEAILVEPVPKSSS